MPARSIALAIVLLFALPFVSSRAHAQSSIVPFSTADKQAILDQFNALRANVAAGLEPGASGNLPAASNMNELVWDEGLATIARDHVATCPPNFNFDKNADHLALYTAQPDLFRYEPSVFFDTIFTGQTIAFRAAQADPGAFDMLFGLWAAEAASYTWGVPGSCSTGDLSGCRNFTQLAWAKTRYVGCAMVSGCTNGFSTILSCNYYPAGNFNESSVAAWESAAPCSACEPDRIECSNSSLCGGCPDPVHPDGNLALPYTPGEKPPFCPQVYPTCAVGCDAFDGCSTEASVLDVSCNVGTGFCTESFETVCAEGTSCDPGALVCTSPVPVPMMEGASRALLLVMVAIVGSVGAIEVGRRSAAQRRGSPGRLDGMR